MQETDSNTFGKNDKVYDIFKMSELFWSHSAQFNNNNKIIIKKKKKKIILLLLPTTTN
jgi:hypothetical protein